MIYVHTKCGKKAIYHDTILRTLERKRRKCPTLWPSHSYCQQCKESTGFSMALHWHCIIHKWFNHVGVFFIIGTFFLLLISVVKFWRNIFKTLPWFPSPNSIRIFLKKLNEMNVYHIIYEIGASKTFNVPMDMLTFLRTHFHFNIQ